MLIEINEKLKAFKNQFQKGIPLTNLHIRKFIKEQRYSLDIGILSFISIEDYIRKAQDLVVYYMIEQIHHEYSTSDTITVFKHTEMDNTPLIQDIFDSYLWRSAALMVISGIDPSDHGRTFAEFAKLPIAKDSLIDFGDAEYIFDLCAFCSTSFEQYFTYSSSVFPEIPYSSIVSVRELIKFHLEDRAKSKKADSAQLKENWLTPRFNDDYVNWYHIPFTNVSRKNLDVDHFNQYVRD